MAKRIFNPPATKEKRQRLRRPMTPQEWTLWQYLRRCTLDGLKFRTQSGVGYYITDFFSFDCMLAIELDGHQHETTEGKSYDEVRDELFHSLGITLLRFPNDRIDTDVLGVLEEVRQTAMTLPRIPSGHRKRIHIKKGNAQ